MSTPSGRIPVTVLTGFLGSGKTTLVNALLQHPQLEDTAVVVNELGEIGLDHLLVTGAIDNVVLLDAGCLCCTVLNTLRETLIDLYGRRSAGEVPHFRRVLVETSGLADPAPILQQLLRDSLVTPYYAFDGLVTTVDAVFAETELDDYGESVQQVAIADRLIVTKTDQTGGVCPPGLQKRLEALNPTAPLLTVRRGVIEPEQILGSSGDSPLNAAMESQPIVAHEHIGAGHDPASRHAASIRADAFFIDKAIGWAGLAAWTDLVVEFFGRKMLRCKGILQISGVDRPVLVQGVQTVFASPIQLGEWPDDDHRSRLVCISNDLEAKLLRSSLEVLHAEPGTYRPATIEDLLELTPSK